MSNVTIDAMQPGDLLCFTDCTLGTLLTVIREPGVRSTTPYYRFMCLVKEW